MSGLALTAEQVRLFRPNGFLKLDGRLPDDLVSRLRHREQGLRGPPGPVSASTEASLRRTWQTTRSGSRPVSHSRSQPKGR